MKTKVISFLIVLFVIGVMGTAFAQSEDEALRLYKDGTEAYQQGKHQEAHDYKSWLLNTRQLAGGMKTAFAVRRNVLKVLSIV